jgi:hypothetical protein
MGVFQSLRLPANPLKKEKETFLTTTRVCEAIRDPPKTLQPPILLFSAKVCDEVIGSHFGLF